MVTRLPIAEVASKTHECSTCPSTSTLQAKHCSIPQPYFVPVSPRMSRRTQSSGISLGAVTAWFTPLTFNVYETVSAIKGASWWGNLVQVRVAFGEKLAPPG